MNNKHRVFSEQWDSSVCYCHGIYMSRCICQNPQNWTTQRISLQVNHGLYLMRMYQYRFTNLLYVTNVLHLCKAFLIRETYLLKALRQGEILSYNLSSNSVSLHLYSKKKSLIVF